MIQRGDVYFASLGYCTGSEQGGERPVIIIQNNKGNTFSPTVLVACITKRRKKNLPTHVILPKELGFEYDSVVMTEQIKTLDKSRIGNFVCHVPDEYMEMVDKSLKVSFGMVEKEQDNMEKLQIFENEEFGNVRTIQNPDGSISINAEDTAIGFGWTQTKAGKIYVRWETINAYCKELEFSQLVGKETYIPESIFYMLAMKANNDRAFRFQKWIAMDVLPSIRKTGSYNNPQNMSPEEQIKLIATGYVEMSEKIDNVEKELENFKNDMPLLGVEETRITTAVRSKGVRVLGGKDSNAYADKSLRRRVFSDIYRELKRQFQVGTYKAIKRSQCEVALEIINDYEPPLALEEEIRDCNAQESFVSEIA